MMARGFGASALLLTAVALACCFAPPLAPDQPGPQAARLAPVAVITETSPLPEPPVYTPRENSGYEAHGSYIPDPYLWLENADDPRVGAWIRAQNRVLEQALGAVAGRDQIRARLEELMQVGDVSVPTVRRTRTGAMRYFMTRRDGHQDQSVLLVRDGLGGKDRTLVDPNELGPSGTVALDWYYPSWDGSLVAYGLSQNGSEQSELRLLEVDSGRSLPDRIVRTRHCSLCWKPDGSGFYYSRLVASGSSASGEEAFFRKIHEHVLGRDPDLDPVVFGEGRDPTEYPGCAISPNGRWLVVRTNVGWNKSELFLADTTAPELEFAALTAGLEHLYQPLPQNDVLYVSTNEDAPRYALYAVDPERPQRSHWRRVVPEHGTDVLLDFNVVADQVLGTYLHDGFTRLERFDRVGRSLGEVALPALGTSDGFSGLHDGSEAFFNFESFTVPTRILRLDLGTGATSTFAEVPGPVGADEYQVQAHAARSADGTRVPYLVVRRRGPPRPSSQTPVLLYGYGGFNVSLVPRFWRPGVLWLERGGVYVQANVRGGGEFGEAWHRAGQLANKQNGFDDFIAVAERLVADRIAAPDQLSIYGRSNGGLLISAALTQRPDLFRAAVAGVPLTDMLRFDRFLLAKLWVPEYGSPDDPEQFGWLREYSPYHRVRPGTPYPAVLLLTAESDTRVDPLHARKLAAALQYATSSRRPVLLRTELLAGHGAGKPAGKLVEEYTDVFSFLLSELGQLPGQ